MFVQRLDHVTILTRDLAASVGFYEQVLGLSQGPRPPFGFAGSWLYGGTGQALLHLIAISAEPGAPAQAEGAGGGLDHFALRCTDLFAFERHLQQLRHPYRSALVPATGEHQIFLRDPVNQVSIECVFAAEAAGALPKA